MTLRLSVKFSSVSGSRVFSYQIIKILYFDALFDNIHIKKVCCFEISTNTARCSSKQKGSHLVLNFTQQLQILKGLTLKYFEQKASLAS